MRYLAISDLHGLDKQSFKDGIYKTLPDFHPSVDKVVIAGDISDGLGNEDELIDYLMWLDKKGALIAVRGNHDVPQASRLIEDVPIGVNLSYMSFNSDEQIDWLYNLPFEFENEHFKLVHGIWVDDKTKSEISEIDAINLSIWGSPVLIDYCKGDTRQWWNMKESVVNTFLKNNKTIADYEAGLDKMLLCGHFTNRSVKSKDVGNVFKYDKDGFPSYGKIQYLDTDVIWNREAVFKLLEFKDVQ